MADIGGAREQAAYQSNFGTLRCSGAGAQQRIVYMKLVKLLEFSTAKDFLIDLHGMP